MTALPSSGKGQLTLDFEPTWAERFGSTREFLLHRTLTSSKEPKAIAADMDTGASLLMRKLNPSEGDPHCFNVNDLDKWLRSTGDAAAFIQYIAAKYLPGGDEARRSRAIATVEELLPQIEAALRTMKGRR